MKARLGASISLKSPDSAAATSLHLRESTRLAISGPRTVRRRSRSPAVAAVKMSVVKDSALNAGRERRVRWGFQGCSQIVAGIYPNCDSDGLRCSASGGGGRAGWCTVIADESATTGDTGGAAWNFTSHYIASCNENKIVLTGGVDPGDTVIWGEGGGDTGSQSSVQTRPSVSISSGPILSV